MAEPLTADEQHRQIRKAAQANPTQKNRLWAIYDRNGVRCSGWYLRRRDALASMNYGMNYWRNDYYKRGYRCHRGEESDAKA